MKIFARLAGSAALFTVLWLLSVPEGSTMPHFSRKYRTSCVTCHEAFPKRNAVGEAFRMRGFRFVDDDTYRKQEPVELGDPAYRRLWPHAISPTTLPDRIPMSFVGRFLAEIDLGGDREESFTFLFPEELEMVVGDAMGEKISFYGDVIYISKDFAGGEVIESWINAKAWLQFQNVIGPENVFNLKVGTVGTNGMGLYTARDANTFTTHFYQYSTWGMPAVNPALSGLTVFDGNDFTLQPLAGIEVNGVGQRWLYAGGLVSGDVINPVNEIPEDSFYMVGVSEKAPSDLFLQLAYKIGGLPLDGSAAKAESPLSADPEFWRDDHCMVSLFGYLGSADIVIHDSAGLTSQSEDDFWRLGLGFQAKYKDLTLGAAVMLGNNDNPYGRLSPQSVDTTAWMAEAYYFVYPWLIPYVRYESLDLDLPSGVAGLNPNQDRDRIIVGARAAIRPNIMANLEASFYNEDEEIEQGVYDTLFVLLHIAF